jgi:hypothetical protein
LNSRQGKGHSLFKGTILGKSPVLSRKCRGTVSEKFQIRPGLLLGRLPELKLRFCGTTLVRTGLGSLRGLWGRNLIWSSGFQIACRKYYL